MKIAVCIKAVSKTLDERNTSEGSMYALNAYDSFSLLNILQSKADAVDISVTCICMGPPSAESVLRRCLAMGADDAVLLSDSRFSGADTFATSHVLAQAIRKMKFDVVIGGQKSVDGETGHVVYGIASRLELLCVSNVTSTKILDGRHLLVRYIDEDSIKSARVQVPVVLAFNDYNVSNTVSLLQLKQARGRRIGVLNADDLQIAENECGQAGSKTLVLRSTAQNMNSKRETEFIDSNARNHFIFLREKLKEIC